MFSLIQTSQTSILILLSTITILLVHKIHGWRTTARRKESIAIVVLGDIARSPRIIRHALSFADQQCL
ncbi:mannosyltransferase [Puccinia graminis f. sp. tritici]|uniref:Mannosyltransferase n=1 Tax=Puccinia graminis f. sp. tritici TaxID=56615 RepID=A0A5B0Q2K7_PUCGR|nr:mannosyltransferase [Puccinia graminis f. sp. tritici]